MQVRKLLIATALVTGGNVVSAADVLMGQVPIGLTDTFTMELTGCPTTTTSSNAKYVKNTVTGVVTLYLPTLDCVASASPGTYLTNLPSEIVPAKDTQIAILVLQNFKTLPGMLTAPQNGTQFQMGYFTGSTMSTAFVVGQTKGISNIVITYQGYPDT